MLDYDTLHKELLPIAEEYLNQTTDEGMAKALFSLVSDEPEQIRKRSDTDLILIAQLAVLGLLYVGKRRQDLKELEP